MRLSAGSHASWAPILGTGFQCLGLAFQRDLFSSYMILSSHVSGTCVCVSLCYHITVTNLFVTNARPFQALRPRWKELRSDSQDHNQMFLCHVNTTGDSLSLSLSVLTIETVISCTQISSRLLFALNCASDYKSSAQKTHGFESTCLTRSLAVVRNTVTGWRKAPATYDGQRLPSKKRHWSRGSCWPRCWFSTNTLALQ